MYHFMHKHRYWFAAIALVTVVGLFVFQAFFDDEPGGLPDSVNAPADREAAAE